MTSKYKRSHWQYRWSFLLCIIIIYILHCRIKKNICDCSYENFPSPFGNKCYKCEWTGVSVMWLCLNYTIKKQLGVSTNTNQISLPLDGLVQYFVSGEFLCRLIFFPQLGVPYQNEFMYIFCQTDANICMVWNKLDIGITLFCYLPDTMNELIDVTERS